MFVSHTPTNHHHIFCFLQYILIILIVHFTDYSES